MADATTTRRWFHPTPDRLILVLLAVEGLLFMADWFRWLPKGWPVLIGIAAVGAVMLLMVLWFLLGLLFRWRFQFSVRSLLVLVVAVAVPCSWLAVEMKKAGEQKATVEAIEKVKGNVWYFNATFPLSSCEEPFEELPGPTWLRNAVGDHFSQRHVI